MKFDRLEQKGVIFHSPAGVDEDRILAIVDKQDFAFAQQYAVEEYQDYLTKNAKYLTFLCDSEWAFVKGVADLIKDIRFTDKKDLLNTAFYYAVGYYSNRNSSFKRVSLLIDVVIDIIYRGDGETL